METAKDLVESLQKRLGLVLRQLVLQWLQALPVVMINLLMMMTGLGKKQCGTTK